MGRNSQSKNSVCTFALNKSISISTINSFYNELKNILQTPTTVVVDASEVVFLDTAALQLLCSWYSEATNRGIKIKWKNAEGILLESANLLGVAAYLGLEKCSD